MKVSRIQAINNWWERHRTELFTLLLNIEEGWLLIQLLLLVFSGPWSDIQNAIRYYWQA